MNDEEFEQLLESLEPLDADQFVRVVSKLSSMAYDVCDSSGDDAWGEASILLRDTKEVLNGRAGN